MSKFKQGERVKIMWHDPEEFECVGYCDSMLKDLNPTGEMVIRFYGYDDNNWKCRVNVYEDKKQDFLDWDNYWIVPVSMLSPYKKNNILW